MKTRKTIFYGLLAVILALTLALTLVACGDEEEDSKTPFPTDGTLEEKLTWVGKTANVEDGETYTIEVTADETISEHIISPDRDNITIVLKGIGAERKISPSERYLFSVGNNVTLVLDENITLQGKSDSTTSLVNVRGVLEMKEGAKIIGNTALQGGGVNVEFGTFIMSGGEISGNTATGGIYGGGGVVVRGNGGTFTMSGGKIFGNTAHAGGGVYVSGGTSFTKTGGTIYGYSESDMINSNVANTSAVTGQANGHAVYATSLSENSVLVRLKNTTTGPGDNLSFNGTTNPPTAEGTW